MKTKSTERLILFSLSLLIMLNSVGVFVFTYIEVGFHRAEVYGEKHFSNTDLLTLNEKQFKSIAWIGERDFIFDGSVYDCERIYASKGKINLECVGDSEETLLKNNLAKTFDQPSKSIPISKSLKEFFKVFPVFKNEISKNNFTSREVFSFSYCTFSKLLPPLPELSLSSPPPKVG